MNLILLFKLLVLGTVLGEDCEIDCSNIVEPVCGSVNKRDGTTTTEIYQNLCYFNRMKCRLKGVAYIKQIPGNRCGIKTLESRRVFDFSIAGAHQSCNHSCPTYCVDTYEPVCAIIYYYKDTVKKTERRTMINHCHVDLFSCSLGVNVSIAAMNKCINSHSLLFMSSMAAMKSLGFLNEGLRRSFTPDSNERSGLKHHGSGKLLDVSNGHASAETTSREGKVVASDSSRLGWIVIL